MAAAGAAEVVAAVEVAAMEAEAAVKEAATGEVEVVVVAVTPPCGRAAEIGRSTAGKAAEATGATPVEAAARLAGSGWSVTCLRTAHRRRR